MAKKIDLVSELNDNEPHILADLCMILVIGNIDLHIINKVRNNRKRQNNNGLKRNDKNKIKLLAMQ